MSTSYSNAPTRSVSASSTTRSSSPVIFVITLCVLRPTISYAVSSSEPPRLFLRAAKIIVAKRDRQGVGDVGRLGQLRQAQLAADRRLHLGFGRTAVAGQHLLDLRGAVVDDRDAGLAPPPGRSRRGHAPSECSSAAVRSASRAAPEPSPWAEAAAITSAHAVVNLDEPGRQRVLRFAAHHAGLDHLRSSRIHLQHPVAGDVQAGIDAENAECGVRSAECGVSSSSRSRRSQ